MNPPQHWNRGAGLLWFSLINSGVWLFQARPDTFPELFLQQKRTSHPSVVFPFFFPKKNHIIYIGCVFPPPSVLPCPPSLYLPNFMFFFFLSFELKRKIHILFGSSQYFLISLAFIVLCVSQLGLALSLQGLTFQLPASAWLAKDPGRKGDDGFSCANGYQASGGCLHIAPVIRTKHFLSGSSAAF